MNLILRNEIPFPIGFRSSGFDAPIERLMDGMLEDLFPPYASLSSAAGGNLSAASIPRVNVSENDKAFEVEAELPGVPKDGVKVAVDKRRVTIEAEVKREADKKEGENIVYAERAVRRFSRSFALPAEVDDANAQARLENGILTLTLPKKEAAQAKRIAIR